jgi:hypothetical protein
MFEGVTNQKISVTYAYIQPPLGHYPAYVGVHLPNQSTVKYDPKRHEIVGKIPLEAILMIEAEEQTAGQYKPDDPGHERDIRENA